MPDKESLLRIYEQMLRIRLFELKATELFGKGLVTGSMHLYIGQEAIAATAGELLRTTDTITAHTEDTDIVSPKAERQKG